jgi:hypothetical protein
VLSAADESKLFLSLILAGLTRDVATTRRMFLSSRQDPALARAYRKESYEVIATTQKNIENACK